VTFSAPIWLAVAALVIGAGVLGLRVAESRRRRDLERFVAGPLLAALTATSSARRRLAKGGLLLAALALGCVALARPTLGWRQEEMRHRGTDVLFAVDVSRSMLAEDVKPDRLSRARLAVIDLLQKLEGDRVGLVAFAGSAFLQAPLTADHAAFRQSLEALDTDVIPRGGTDIGAALHEAEEAFRIAGQSQKLLVLVTDGEDLTGNARVAAQEAAKQGITVYTVGVGTPTGERIPLARAGGRGLVLDERGNPVTSKLDEAGLRAIAEATGGFYVPLGAHGEGLDTIYQRVLAEAPKQEFATRMQRIPIERYQWPLGLALALVVGEVLLGERRRSRVAMAAPRAVRALASVAPLLGVLLLATTAFASPRDAEKAYAAGAYDEALAHYRAAAQAAPDDARLRFNEGVAAYRAGKHDEAAEAFSKALEGADVQLQQRAYYDLGNARFRMGEAAAKSQPEQARSALEDSVKAYEAALALDPKDENARFNRDLAKARLEELKQQEEQEKQQQKDQQQQDQTQGQGEPQDQQQGQPQSQEPAGKPAGEPQQADQDPSKSGGEPQQAEQQPRPGDEPSQKSKSDAAPERADGKREGAAPSAGGREARPGEMSAEDAARLLDSLRGDEQQAPRAASKRGGDGRDDDEPTRNW
jgi:Ca-activated chloride channel family protein